MNPAVSARPAGWLAWLAGLAGCLRDDDSMPVTATGTTSFYSTLPISLSDSLLLSFSFLFPPEVEIFISGDRDSPIARTLPLFSRQPRYLRDSSRAFMFLSSTMLPCSFPSCSLRTSSSYFSSLFCLSLFYSQ